MRWEEGAGEALMRRGGKDGRAWGEKSYTGVTEGCMSVRCE